VAHRLAATWSPNPFNPSIELRLTVPSETVAGGARTAAGAAAAAGVPVRVAVYDPRGRLVRSLLDGPLAPGPHRLVWDGRDGRGRSLGSGVYLYTVQAGSSRASGKLTLVR
jgi:flagellar hook assembly protein FlgD